MLTDLRDTLDAPVLRLPIGGIVYEVTECDAATWLRLQEVNQRNTAATAGDPEADADSAGMSELELCKLTLGDTYQQMIDGGVRPSELRHAGVTAFYWQLGVEDVATAWWESGGKAPEAPAGRSRSTSTGTRVARSSTASRTSTTPRKRSQPKKAG